MKITIKIWNMKGVKVWAILLVGLFSSFAVRAQEKWTLQACIDYTLENNLDLRIQSLDVKDKEYLFKDADNQWLPSLSGDMRFTEYVNQSGSLENTNVAGSSFGANLGLSANMILFNGFALKNRTARARTDAEAAVYDMEARQNDVLMLLLSSYLDILLKQEIAVVAQEQLNSTREEKKAVTIKYEFGEVSKDVYLETIAQEARESATLDETMNNVAYAKLILAHVLDLEDPERFDVVVPELPDLMAKVSLQDAAQIFENARLVRPEIKSAEKAVESSEFMVKEASSGFYPSVSLFAGFSARYYNIHNVNNLSLADQLDFSSQPYVGMGVSIPIFSKFSNKNNKSRARLNNQVKELELLRLKNGLRETIKEAYVKTVAAHSKYKSAASALEATRESYRFAEEKYKVGSLSPYEFTTAKSQLMRAESELLQAKYQFIFSAKVLDFYKGEPIRL